MECSITANSSLNETKRFSNQKSMIKGKNVEGWINSFHIGYLRANMVSTNSECYS